MPDKNIPLVMVIFGGSGDLAHRKLYPALFNLFEEGLLARNFAILGTARRPWTHEYLRQQVIEAVQEANPGEELERDELDSFAAHFFYQSHDVTQPAHYQVLKATIQKLDKKFAAGHNRIFYLAMAPRFFGTIADQIYQQHLLGDGFNRLVIEKPFGRDLNSATKLNDQIAQAFAEKDVYRIDHYLGKEMVQNILPMRLSNPLIKNIWNHRYIKNVQVTLAESLGVEARGGYYETAGALRDMVQNHIFQIITLLAMPAPADLTSGSVHAAKQALWDSVIFPSSAMVARNFARGQYAKSSSTFAYREEPNVDPHSLTETFVAGEIKFLGGPLAKVPIYFRTGKRLREKQSRIDIVLQSMNNLYGKASSNTLSIVVDPDMCFYITVNGKKITEPGLRSENLIYRFSQEELRQVPDGYERLLHDVLVQDRTNFTHWRELQKFWEYIDTVEDAWLAEDKTIDQLDQYPPFKMGPAAANQIFEDATDRWVYR